MFEVAIVQAVLTSESSTTMSSQMFGKDTSPVLQRREVVTAFLRHAGKILLVQRSAKTGSYQRRWAGISGYLEDPTPLQQVLREIREETGLEEKAVHLVRAGKPLEVRAPELATCWIVYPFLFDIDAPDQIRLDWENTELRWLAPEQLQEYPTVPALAQALAACLEDSDGQN